MARKKHQKHSAAWNQPREFGTWSLVLAPISILLGGLAWLVYDPGALLRHPWILMVTVLAAAVAITGALLGVFGAGPDCPHRKQANIGLVLNSLVICAIVVLVLVKGG